MPKANLKKLVGPYNGLADKIAFARRVRWDAPLHPEVRAFAEAAIGRGTRTDQAIRLFGVLKRGVNYVADTVGTEYTKAPWVMVQEIKNRGYSSGDCDDQATLAYALLNLVGVPARLRVAWYGGSEPQHIYAVAWLDRRWVPFDTTSRFGKEPAATKTMDFE